MNPTVMIVSHDTQPALLAALLSTHGYQVRAVPGARAASEDKGEPPAAIIVDFGASNADGPDLCRQLQRRHNVPLLAVARPDEAFEVALLDAGADDYLAKPYGTKQLLARIRLALRHGKEPVDTAPLSIGVFRIDFQDRRVSVKGRPVRLTPKEFDLFVYMAQRPNRVIRHGTLLSAVWGEASSDRAEYLRVFIGQLRKKLESDPANPEHLVTEPWVGYRLNPSPTTPAGASWRASGEDAAIASV